MIQKTIRPWGGVPYTNNEADELTQELNDRTVYGVDGYNSVAEIGAKTADIKTKTDFITVTGSVDLDDEKSATSLNTAKRSYPSADETKLSGIETGATADQSDAEIKIAYENNADTNAYTDAEKSKVADAPQLSDGNTFTGANNVFEEGISLGAGLNMFLGLSGGKSYIGASDDLIIDALGSGIDPAIRFRGGGVNSLETEETGTNWFLPATSISQLNYNTGTKAIPTVEWVEEHSNSTSNPHGVTASQIGAAQTSAPNTFTSINTFQHNILAQRGDNTTGTGGQVWIGDGDSRGTALLGDDDVLDVVNTNTANNTETWKYNNSGTPNDDDILRRKELVTSTTVGEPSGSDRVVNMVSLTQAEYDAGTPNATTFYVITDA